MKCVVINLKHAVERREQIDRQLTNLNIAYEFCVGVNGSELTEQEIIQHADLCSNLIDWEHPNAPGSLGCWISHRNVWESALNAGEELIVVLEDDAALSPKFANFLEYVARFELPRFDIIFLHNNRPHRPFTSLVSINPEFTLGLVKFWDLGAQGYLITRRAMQTLLHKYPIMPIELDRIMCADWHTNLQSYTLHPPVVYHGESGLGLHPSYISSNVKKKRTFVKKIHNILEFGIPKRVSYYRRLNGFSVQN